MEKYIEDCKELIYYDEWGIGFEILVSNLGEIDFKIDNKTIELAEVVVKKCKMSYDLILNLNELVEQRI